MEYMEYKFTPLSQMKMSDSGSGSIEGHRAIFSRIDDGGDVIVKGAFANSIDSYLNSGFSAHSHLWTFAESIGFPVEAREDAKGFFVKSAFHSTQTAQDVRTIAKERLKAGKTVGFSFGYGVLDSENISPGEYELKLPRFLKTDRLDQELVKAQRFSSIRILKKLEIYEDSIVTMPMNREAGATAVKGLHARRSANHPSALRLEGLRIRSHALQTLYGPSIKRKLEIEGERLSREAEHIALKLRVVESRLRSQRYRM